MLDPSVIGHLAPLATSYVQGDPMILIKPIAIALGWVVDFIFKIIYSFTQANSLGFAIILLTIFARILMIPLAMKQQKSMVGMQKIQPEMNAIKKKYGNSKDPEIQRKMNVEMQALYSKHKINPFSGCLPMLITLPIFFALNYIMNQSFLYITELKNIYNELATGIWAIPDYARYCLDLIHTHVPNSMKNFRLDDIANMVKGLNRLTAAEWNTMFSNLLNNQSFLQNTSVHGNITNLQALVQSKEQIEMFFGIPLTEPAGLTFPKIIIPIVAVLTSFASSYVLSKVQVSADKSMATQQKVMMFAMPLMMGFFTVSAAAGVGIYWITSSVFQTVQQVILNNIYRKRLAREEAAAGAKEEIVVREEKPKKKKGVRY